MKHPKEHRLLDELLTGDEVAEFREASLSEALRVLRRTQRRRRVLRGAAVAILPMLLIVAVGLFRSLQPVGREPAQADQHPMAAAPDEPRPSTIEFISDEELLSLFPNQPLALVGPEGRQQLVFLDQARVN